MREMLLPHFNERRLPVDMLVLHATAHCGEDAVRCLDTCKLSCHYVVTQEGEILKVVDESKRAWHAGVSCWRGDDEDLNSRSVGIEVCSPSLGQEPFTEEQIKALVPLCRGIIRRHGIPPQNVVGHSDIAPLRKPDPGLAFPWRQLSHEGIGLWYDEERLQPEDDIAFLLGMIGYDVRSKAVVQASAYAFCRRFAPQFVQKDANVPHLVEHILPDDFGFMADREFLKILKAVAFAYK